MPPSPSRILAILLTSSSDRSLTRTLGSMPAFFRMPLLRATPMP